jgi:predicted DNA-binding transcriptional regulator YafY
MRQFLDQLPRVIATKPDPLRRAAPEADGHRSRLIARALEATLHQRQASLTYYSKSSDRTKTYQLHPYRLAYAQGGLYLLAYVPEYGEVRTFAVERIEDMSLLEERFVPLEDLPEEAFPNSLGVHSGPTERVTIEFQEAVADYVRARAWHRSQQMTPRADGGLTLTLDVCLDRALRSWILSFGPFARVMEPQALAREVAAELSEARAQYVDAGASPVVREG